MLYREIVEKTVKNFTPKEKGILFQDEVKALSKSLKLDEFSTVDDLRNLRDFTVMYFHWAYRNKEQNIHEEYELMDKLSAITGIIDRYIFDKGGEV